MPRISTSVENNFTKGLITEATGLSFPENAAFDTDNCVYEIIGDVVRREGFDFELNNVQSTTDRTGKAISTYKWNNVGGDGSTQIVVTQVGNILSFYLSSNTTVTLPLSAQKLTTTVDISTYKASGTTNDPSISECSYADGNGYLFVYHKDCDPFYCYFTPGTVSTAQVIPNKITVQIRDFLGVYPEPGNPNITSRPSTLTNEHNYNLQNQGWTAQQLWSLTSSTVVYTNDGTNLSLSVGNHSWTVAAGIPNITAGQPVFLSVSGAATYTNGGNIYFTGYNNGSTTLSGVVVSYVGTTITVNITQGGIFFSVPGNSLTPTSTSWILSQSTSQSTISTFQSSIGLYPSNTDIWFTYKNTSGVFSPSTTIGNVGLSSTKAPNGHFILNAFQQLRSATSGISGITDITTTQRPTNGCWFAGRVFYTGVNASQTATGDVPYYTWTENIYFSQIIENTTQFGYCYQGNDPTAENFFDLLPTDGGVITIQGTGPIYELFPLQNGLVVRAANGIWFITGSQGIGFAANDYTVTKISGVQSISSIKSVNVQGYPVFCNEEGIYAITPSQTGGLTVNNLCLGTILTYYSNIPLQSKKYMRGDYNPIDYIVQWTFRSTNESSVTNRYEFDKILCYNTANKAFYPYSFTGSPKINGVMYVAGPGGSTSPAPTFKYLVSYQNLGAYKFTFAEERDITHYKDWFSLDSIGVNYTSFFTTGYKLRGDAQRRWQPGYVYLFLRNSVINSYKVQGLWEFGISGNSGKWSTVQVINDTTDVTKFGVIYHRHKIRGHGLVFQLKVSSVDGKPFDVVGWSMFEVSNEGV